MVCERWSVERGIEGSGLEVGCFGEGVDGYKSLKLV